MGTTDDTSKKQPTSNPTNVSAETSKLEQAIEAERARLLQVHSVLNCLYAILIDDVVAQLDSVRLRPMIEAMQRSARLEGRYTPPEPKGLTSGSKDDDNAVR